MPRATSASARKGSKGAAPAMRSAVKKAPPVAARTAGKSTPKPNGSGKAARPAAREARTARVEPARRASEKIVHGRSVVESVVTSRGKYVYCIIESADPLRFGPIGIG